MQEAQGGNKSDFSTGSVYRHIVSLAIPMAVAQMVQMLYNIVDRIYIGHLPGGSYLALTGLGLTFPIITLVMAFTSLFGMGGAPLFSIARGRQEAGRAQRIMGNTFAMLCASSLALMALCYVLMKPMLYLFGAGDASYPYARQYLLIYLLGTPFTMVGTGLNGFINAQGFAKTGMVTILLGAAVNIALDPVFIFVLGMGVAGAALATVLSQLLSAAWVLSFLTGKHTLLKITPASMKLDRGLLREITSLGTAGFIMSASNGAVQIACNATLKGSLCGCDDGFDFGAGDGGPAHAGADQRRPARAGVQLWRAAVRAGEERHRVRHRHIGGVHGAGVAAAVFIPGPSDGRFHLGRAAHRQGRAGPAPVFFRPVHDGLPKRGPVRLRGAGPV